MATVYSRQTIQIALFKALNSTNVDDEVATNVVDKMDGHVAMKIDEATKGLESKIDTTNKLIVVIGFILTALSTFGVVATVWLQLIR